MEALFNSCGVNCKGSGNAQKWVPEVGSRWSVRTDIEEEKRHNYIMSSYLPVGTRMQPRSNLVEVEASWVMRKERLCQNAAEAEQMFNLT